MTIRIFAVAEIFSVEYCRDFEIWIRGRSRALKMAQFDKSCMSSYSSFIVTTALSCIVSEIKQDISRKSRFFILSLHMTPSLTLVASDNGRNNCLASWSPDAYATTWCNSIDEQFNHLSTVHERHRPTDDTTDGIAMT